MKHQRRGSLWKSSCILIKAEMFSWFHYSLAESKHAEICCSDTSLCLLWEPRLLTHLTIERKFLILLPSSVLLYYPRRLLTRNLELQTSLLLSFQEFPKILIKSSKENIQLQFMTKTLWIYCLKILVLLLYSPILYYCITIFPFLTKVLHWKNYLKMILKSQ